MAEMERTFSSYEDVVANELKAKLLSELTAVHAPLYQHNPLAHASC